MSCYTTYFYLRCVALSPLHFIRYPPKIEKIKYSIATYSLSLLKTFAQSFHTKTLSNDNLPGHSWNWNEWQKKYTTNFSWKMLALSGTVLHATFQVCLHTFHCVLHCICALEGFNKIQVCGVFLFFWCNCKSQSWIRFQAIHRGHASRKWMNVWGTLPNLTASTLAPYLHNSFFRDRQYGRKLELIWKQCKLKHEQMKGSLMQEN